MAIIASDAAGVVSFLVYVVVFGGVGLLIGLSKKRPMTGFFLGVFLNCFGLVIALCLPRVKSAADVSNVWVHAPSGTPPGWFPDPRGRFQSRFWDGAAWTDHVRSNDVASTDPLGV